jgi:hypothetical protein
MSQKITAIITHPHFQADTLAALVILAYYGLEKYPGIAQAPVKFMVKLPEGQTGEQLEQEGIIALDMGGGRFDHHRSDRQKEKDCLTDLVILDLGLKGNPAVEKIRLWARRDDLQGQGTLSRDTLDRAFGLSGLIQNLTRRYKDNPVRIMQAVLPILEAHLWEEEMRHTAFPEEYKELKNSGKVEEFTVFQEKKSLKAVMIESDTSGLVNFARANSKIKADLVLQKLSSGHINIITNQQQKINLNCLAVILRIEEAKKKGMPLDQLSKKELIVKGKMAGLEEWYFDTAANSIQNGGIRPESAPPTALSLTEVKQALIIGLDSLAAKKAYPEFF